MSETNITSSSPPRKKLPGAAWVLLAFLLVYPPLLWICHQGLTNEVAARAALRVDAEPLRTRFLESAVGQREQTGVSKVPLTTSYWTSVETQDWVLLNGYYGTKTCWPVLRDFGGVNTPYPVMSVEVLNVLILGFRERDVELFAHVPRFKQAPAGLERCSEYAFDSARGLLTTRGKPVAFLAASQPGLLAAERELLQPLVVSAPR